MKRVINCATKSDILDRVKSGFTSAGCEVVEISDISDDHCDVSLVLPSGIPTRITVWYSHNVIKNGFRRSRRILPWDKTYHLDEYGNVYDSNNNLIGIAIVDSEGEIVQRTRKNYLIKSIRTDSGDVIIDHPEKSNNYKSVVDTLENRLITYRS